jgi:hypothetical protein
MGENRWIGLCCLRHLRQSNLYYQMCGILKDLRKKIINKIKMRPRWFLKRPQGTWSREGRQVFGESVSVCRPLVWDLGTFYDSMKL